MFFARKITLAKWEAKRGVLVGEIPADAVTVDLRTQDNALSFWQFDVNDKSELENAVLAIASAGSRLDRLDIVWLSENELQDDGQSYHDSLGQTPLTDFADRHVDVSCLDYVRLGKIAHRILAAIKEERHCRIRKIHIKRLLNVAVKQRRIELNDLQDKIANSITRE